MRNTDPLTWVKPGAKLSSNSQSGAVDRKQAKWKMVKDCMQRQLYAMMWQQRDQNYCVRAAAQSAIGKGSS
jgi:hypothetical protein